MAQVREVMRLLGNRAPEWMLTWRWDLAMEGLGFGSFRKVEPDLGGRSALACSFLPPFYERRPQADNNAFASSTSRVGLGAAVVRHGKQELVRVVVDG